MEEEIKLSNLGSPDFESIGNYLPITQSPDFVDIGSLSITQPLEFVNIGNYASPGASDFDDIDDYMPQNTQPTIAKDGNTTFANNFGIGELENLDLGKSTTIVPFNLLTFGENSKGLIDTWKDSNIKDPWTGEIKEAKDVNGGDLAYDYFYNFLNINGKGGTKQFGGLDASDMLTSLPKIEQSVNYNLMLTSESDYVDNWIKNNESKLKKKFESEYSGEEGSEEYKKAYEEFLKKYKNMAKEKYKELWEQQKSLGNEWEKLGNWFVENFWTGKEGEDNFWVKALNDFTGGLVDLANNYLSNTINSLLGKGGNGIPRGWKINPLDKNEEPSSVMASLCTENGKYELYKKGHLWTPEKIRKGNNPLINSKDISANIPAGPNKGQVATSKMNTYAYSNLPDMEKVNSTLRVLFNKQLGLKDESEAFFRLLNDDPLLSSSQFLLWTYKKSAVDEGKITSYKIYNFRLQDITLPDFTKKSESTKYGFNLLQLQPKDNVTVKNYADGTILCDKKLNSLSYLFDYLGIGVDEGRSCDFISGSEAGIEKDFSPEKDGVTGKFNQNEIFNISNIHDKMLEVAKEHKRNTKGTAWQLEPTEDMERDLGELETYAVLEIIPGSYIQREHNEPFGKDFTIGKFLGKPDLYSYMKTPYFVFENFRIYKATPRFSFKASSDSTNLLKIKVGFSWTKMEMKYRDASPSDSLKEFGEASNIKMPWSYDESNWGKQVMDNLSGYTNN